MPRYLTKSRYKLGLECPTKLFYTKKEEYVDQKLTDEFLQALAEGGFQVGELAKLYYPGGFNIEDLDYENALARTNELLQLPEVIIYEAAFLYKNFFVRTDILIKKGNEVQLIEVKAKSFDSLNEQFLNEKGYLLPKWAPYLYDAAFQKYVAKNSHPEFNITAYLFLTDKSKTASVDGLNQKFLITKVDGRKQVTVKGPVDEAALGEKILTLQNIDDIVERIYAGTDQKEKSQNSFEEQINFFAEKYAADEKIAPVLGSACCACEFRLTVEDAKGLKSGFHECWREKASFTETDFLKPSVLDIWNFRKKDDCIQAGIYFQDNIIIESYGPSKTSKEGTGLTQWERQKLQIQKSIANDPAHYIDIPSLIDLQKEWTYPYHFIDFETTSVAIPFHRGLKPYEAIAFQFSHHVMYENGKIEHRGEWLANEPGVFPNFHFIRALKEQLSHDDGTIFRYAAFENTIVNNIYQQLLQSQEPDKNELRDFIKSISHSSSASAEKWKGPRDMVDLKDMIQKFYYNPLTKGSISIKEVLPAILNSSGYLKQKYSQPIYGNEIRSLNFINQQWIQFSNNGTVINPYELLPALDENLLFAGELSGISEGGAAMMAYAKMQFTEMSEAERNEISKALLKYCELDTFAMVLIWEALQQWIRASAIA